MPREETEPASAPGSEQVAAQSRDAQIPSTLTAEEQTVLDLLVASGTARTPAQLAAGSRLPKATVAAALDSLRARGLVVRFNTLVDSYGARFPGVDLH